MYLHFNIICFTSIGNHSSFFQPPPPLIINEAEIGSRICGAVHIRTHISVVKCRIMHIYTVNVDKLIFNLNIQGIYTVILWYQGYWIMQNKYHNDNQIQMLLAVLSWILKNQHFGSISIAYSGYFTMIAYCSHTALSNKMNSVCWGKLPSHTKGLLIYWISRASTINSIRPFSLFSWWVNQSKYLTVFGCLESAFVFQPHQNPSSVFAIFKLFFSH